ncbi:MAG: exonuclease SbcCD subunit D [Lachnospiraceae bacterium]|nr:exonuclease SbcCD subunit D [Lachnospiraceae bacterium]
MKFLQVGDVHLGAEPENGTSLGPVRRAEIWEAFRDIIELCEQERVELLLIPGDLFHGQPLLRDVKEVDYLFRRLTNTQVVLIAGNHDCLLTSSHYYDITFPEHVSFLMDTQADSVYLPRLNTEVFGLSYEARQSSEARYDAIHINDTGRINILLAHGNILCNDKSMPIHRSAIETAGFDYAALGHIHNRFEVSERIAYSGSLEPLNRTETGAKGYIIGEIQKEGSGPSRLHWEFVSHARREYVVLELPVSVQSTEFSICEEALDGMRQRGLQHLYLVTLTGIRAKELVWNLEGITTAIRNRGGNVIELRDATVPDFQVERLREEQQDTLVGRFIERMDTIEDEKLRSLALQYGLQALLSRDERK